MNPRRCTLGLMPERLAVCRLEATAVVPDWALAGSFFAVTRTPEELSIVCEAARIPPGVQSAVGWRALRVTGPLDFDEVGILASLATSLAAAGIPIFVLSTYDSDTVLVREAMLQATLAALRAAGHRIDA